MVGAGAGWQPPHYRVSWVCQHDWSWEVVGEGDRAILPKARLQEGWVLKSQHSLHWFFS